MSFFSSFFTPFFKPSTIVWKKKTRASRARVVYILQLCCAYISQKFACGALIFLKLFACGALIFFKNFAGGALIFFEIFDPPRQNYNCPFLTCEIPDPPKIFPQFAKNYIHRGSGFRLGVWGGWGVEITAVGEGVGNYSWGAFPMCSRITFGNV